MTETLTGIVLTGGLLEESQIAGEMPEVWKILRLGLEKYRVPPAERRYVGILSLRSEEQGPSLDGLARTLWMLLSSDLQACPNLILLDREHLEWLRQEKNLTAVEQALKSSTVLVEGGLHRSQDQVELDAAARAAGRRRAGEDFAALPAEGTGGVPEGTGRHDRRSAQAQAAESRRGS